jgi:hypothetical protein
MFRRSSSKLAVSTYTRFLMDGKGKATGIPFLKHARLMTAEYYALKKSPSKFAELARRAANTPRPKKRVPVPRKPNAYSMFTKSAFETKAVASSSKSIASNAKKVAALWKKYKAAVAAKQGGKPLAKNVKVFDMKLLRSLA